MNQAAASSSWSQALFDVQITRRRILAPAGEWSIWPPDLKKEALEAEERLKILNGHELVRALVEYGRTTGQRVKV